MGKDFFGGSPRYRPLFPWLTYHYSFHYLFSLWSGLSHHPRLYVRVLGALGCNHLVSTPSSKRGLARDCHRRYALRVPRIHPILHNQFLDCRSFEATCITLMLATHKTFDHRYLIVKRYDLITLDFCVNLACWHFSQLARTWAINPKP